MEGLNNSVNKEGRERGKEYNIQEDFIWTGGKKRVKEKIMNEGQEDETKKRGGMTKTKRGIK